MSVWGILVGGAAGLALGGPFGALIGAALGLAFIDGPAARRKLATPPDKQVTFTIAALALAAKMAGADGTTSPAELQAFEQLFRVEPGERRMARRFFEVARTSTDGFDAYAVQTAQLLGRGSPLLENLLEALLLIALADGDLHAREAEFLARACSIFGFSPSVLAALQRRYGHADASDPYEILEVAPDADAQEIRRAYHRLAKRHHPDRHIAEGTPQEVLQLAEARMVMINLAYEQIMNALASSAHDKMKAGAQP